MNVWFALTRPLRWRSPRRTAAQLLAFARAERSSYYDLIAAAHEAADPHHRALYLAHAGDEARHAQMFTLRASELCAELGRDPTQSRADFERLFARLGEPRFLAFVHRGECQGRTRLTAFRDEHARRGDHKTRAMLDAILVDEARHAAYTLALLRQLGPRAQRRAERSARLWALGRGFLRAGNAVAQLLFVVAMRALYLSLLPLALILRARTRRKVSLWSPF